MTDIWLFLTAGGNLGGGTDYLYALANNQFGLFANKADVSIPLKSGKWYHITMTFKFNGTSDSFVKMYINGSLISSDDVSSTNTPGACSARGNFQIGSSYGILDSNLRYADADFDEFVILDKALPENEELCHFCRQSVSVLSVKRSLRSKCRTATSIFFRPLIRL